MKQLQREPAPGPRYKQSGLQLFKVAGKLLLDSGEPLINPHSVHTINTIPLQTGVKGANSGLNFGKVFLNFTRRVRHIDVQFLSRLQRVHTRADWSI